MKECSRFREQLLLDVYGETLPEHDKWREHLATCQECQQEREKLKSMLMKVKKSWLFPEPAPFESMALRRSIFHKLDRRHFRLKDLALPFRLPLPALAGAVMILVAGWFGWQQLTPHGVDVGGRESEERLLAQEGDLLEDMELLEDMDVIQKLVQILDKKEAVL
ncbi:MAG: hypothetical protein WHX93_13565 [bacterium]